MGNKKRVNRTPGLTRIGNLEFDEIESYLTGVHRNSNTDLTSHLCVESAREHWVQEMGSVVHYIPATRHLNFKIITIVSCKLSYYFSINV